MPAQYPRSLYIRGGNLYNTDLTVNTITAARIEDGAWLADAPYCAIHRIASAGRVRGVLRACVAWSARRCAHLRADTHADNAPMLRLLPALGFVRCGVVRVADGSPRIAFERLPQDGRA